MVPEAGNEQNEMACPACNSRAVYRYGKTSARRQRYICLMCGRQFLPGRHRRYPKERPLCAACGAKMYLFKRKGVASAVFRCSRYPVCRTYVKVDGALISE